MEILERGGKGGGFLKFEKCFRGFEMYSREFQRTCMGLRRFGRPEDGCSGKFQDVSQWFKGISGRFRKF